MGESHPGNSREYDAGMKYDRVVACRFSINERAVISNALFTAHANSRLLVALNHAQIRLQSVRGLSRKVS